MAPVLSFLNPTKYPASLQFLLMTLGPAFLLVPLLERVRGGVANVLTVFGRVPFFYYVLHIPLIHAAAIVRSLFRSAHVEPELFANHPILKPPPSTGDRWSLGLLYAVWGMIMVVLYFVCRWYGGVRKLSGGRSRS